MTEAGLDTTALQDVLVRELAARRQELVAIDPRLGAPADRLVAFVLDGGKRIRPRFLWLGWRAGQADADTGGTDGSGVLLLGAALELLQASALIHDDVIDRSDRRRGAPATHRALAADHADAGWVGDADHFGVSAAILLGDLALMWADDLFTAGALALGVVPQAAPVWAAMRTEVTAGQLLDLFTSTAATTDPAEQEADAMLVNRYKTAAYTVQRPLHLGAVAAGAPAETVHALLDFGSDIGVAFQLRDDELGVFGDPAVTGKPAGDDLVEGKRTVLLAVARAELAASPDRAAELEDLDRGVGSPAADVERLTAILTATSGPAQVERRISALVASGLGALDRTTPDGRPVVTVGVRSELEQLARRATARRA
ncbi:polyprenyl synthetase family protein [Nakamurella flava]|uniref:Polyprenyl synthetase family protein n=1 Tax=Nakamurella flava TaxID=2576308 RepID=A0A4U6QK50_9ACTN|nr:polyprenyl synthetase family protein [Nakamurella flava]TKV60482.1 polyprenyl synthetase family protein [Nakamurella flava]